MNLKQIFLSAILFFIFIQISAQDLIYKKSGDILKAKILEQSGSSLKYIIPDKTDNTVYFIAISAIDSIIHQNGSKEILIKNIIASQKLSLSYKSGYNHHLVGLNLAGLAFYEKIIVSYEYLPGKAVIGFKAAYATVTKKYNNLDWYAFNFEGSPDWTFKFGINGYIFPPKTFRVGTGIYYVTGSYPIKEYDYNSTISYNHWVVTDHKSINGFVFNAFGYYNIVKNLATNLGLDFPLGMKPSSQFTIRCEILLNF